MTSSHSRKRSGRNRSARPGVSDSHNDSSSTSRICSVVVSAIRSPASCKPTCSISRFSTGGLSVRTNARQGRIVGERFSSRFDDWAFVSWRFGMHGTSCSSERGVVRLLFPFEQTRQIDERLVTYDHSEKTATRSRRFHFPIPKSLLQPRMRTGSSRMPWMKLDFRYTGSPTHLDVLEALVHLFPDHAQLHLPQTVAEAAVNAEAERQMMPRVRAIDQELVRVLDRVRIAVTRDVPHHHFLALLDLLAADLSVFERGACHVRDRRLPTDDLRHHVRDQPRVVAQLLVLVGELVQRQHAAGDGIARGVVAADDEQQNVAEVFVRRMFFVDSPCASIESGRACAGVSTRSFQTSSK